jgi:hypothetical protein
MRRWGHAVHRRAQGIGAARNRRRVVGSATLLIVAVSGCTSGPVDVEAAVPRATLPPRHQGTLAIVGASVVPMREMPRNR